MTTSEELKTISESYESTESLIQKASKLVPNLFIEYVGKDASGNKVVQSFIHKEIQNHIDECKKQGFQNCGILAPWGHGKTEQLIFRVLDWIGQNPNVRIQYICNTDDNATSRVNSIKKYIESDEDYHKVYPHVLPSVDGDWGKHKIIVQRDSKAKDGTVESWGIISSGTGSRSDIQIFDDPVDMRNAILNPSLRLQVKDSLKNVWFPRLVPNGFRVYIATAWHEDDATTELMRNSEWKFLVMRVSEDFSRIECESPFKGKYTLPLWSYWGSNQLKSQLKLIGSRAFERGYRQKPFSDEERMFPSSDKIFRWDLDKSFVHSHWPKVVGCDPFGKVAVIFEIALNPNTQQRVPIKIMRKKMTPKEVVYSLKEIWDLDKPQVLVVENNAAQDAIVQWLNEIGGANIIVLPFTTGSNKANPIMGLPSIEVEFSNGSWMVPMQGIDETDNEHPFNVWMRELRAYPVSESWDTIMAMWFAREGARFLTQYENPKEQEEEIHDQEDILDVERVSIE